MAIREVFKERVSIERAVLRAGTVCCARWGRESGDLLGFGGENNFDGADFGSGRCCAPAPLHVQRLMWGWEGKDRKTPATIARSTAPRSSGSCRMMNRPTCRLAGVTPAGAIRFLNSSRGFVSGGMIRFLATGRS